jgi:protein TonB
MTACVLAALVLAACDKSDKVPTTAERLASVQQKQETTPDFYVPRKTVDYMSDLKNIKDAPKETPKVAERAAAPAPAPAPVAAAPAPAPAPTPAAAAPAKTAPAPAPAQPQPAASAPASNVVASAAPTARPAPAASTTVTVLSREQPDFPREAIRAGAESGTVRARITIGANGEVTNVAIVQAQPARIFDRAVQGALGRWKFNPGADGRTYDTEVLFQR